MLLGQGFGVSTFTTLDLLVRRKNIPNWWWKNGDESHGIESAKKTSPNKNPSYMDDLWIFFWSVPIDFQGWWTTSVRLMFNRKCHDQCHRAKDLNIVFFWLHPVEPSKLCILGAFFEGSEGMSSTNDSIVVWTSGWWYCFIREKSSLSLEPILREIQTTNIFEVGSYRQFFRALPPNSWDTPGCE